MALLADGRRRSSSATSSRTRRTRDPTVVASAYATLQDISNGRMIMGIGRGDSAVRVVGLQPVKVAEFEGRCR